MLPIRETKDGSVTPDQGKYVDIHHRQPDDSWKLHMSIMNSDA